MHVRFFTWGGVQKLVTQAGLKISNTFWDFGTLAHYSDPEMFYPVLKNKVRRSRQAKIFLWFIYPVYLVFDFFFPRELRSRFVGTNPGFWCAGFYLHLSK
jgi:hypothetical protein